ncbi:serine/threonine protein kinase [Clostridium sp. C8-1-8]|uniref:serine/threonine protein kinase n=1 Tax=Clostridium sp. C8-1-8 TaxID=2698831 RepID=UPI00136915AA|nr:serine/threonine protein kinase [Clostridium sp. C8-1-8]
MTSAGFKSFKENNLQKWRIKILEIFNDNVPKRYEWTDINEIIKVLNIIGEENLNHTFFPTGGGLDLSGTGTSSEKDCINLYFGSSLHHDVIKPSKLIFNSFYDDYQWAYFRIETCELEPSGVYDTLIRESEELMDLGEANYVSRHYWDLGFYHDKQGLEQKLPSKAAVVTRFFKGSFVIFAKASIYNSVSGTYDGRHNRMDDERFRKYIETAVDSLNKRNQTSTDAQH